VSLSRGKGGQAPCTHTPAPGHTAGSVRSPNTRPGRRCCGKRRLRSGILEATPKLCRCHWCTEPEVLLARRGPSAPVGTASSLVKSRPALLSHASTPDEPWLEILRLGWWRDSGNRAPHGAPLPFPDRTASPGFPGIGWWYSVSGSQP